MLGAPPLARKLTSVEVGVRLRIPGVKSDDTKIPLTGDVLSTREEIRLEKEKESARYHGPGLRHAFFGRSVALPGPVMADKIKARLQHSMLPRPYPGLSWSSPGRDTVKPWMAVRRSPEGLHTAA